QRYLRRILDRFAKEIDAGVPFVVLEPACAAVFRDELGNLFPGDENAKRLAQQTYLLAEFLERRVPRFSPPHLASRAIVHGHCHQKAVMSMDADEAMLRKLGVDYELLDSGCCGMAGSFGFERDKAGLSVQIGELVLLPAVRAAAPDCLVVADGYSCREQIAQCTQRHAVHLAEVLQMALARRPRRGSGCRHGGERRCGPRDRARICTARRAGRTDRARSGGATGDLQGCRRARRQGAMCVADVAHAAEVESAASMIEDRLGPIDIWVNNAMVTVVSPVASLVADEVRRVTEVTYLGTVHGTLAALRRMRPRDRGAIVQVGSALAYRAIPLQAAYCGSKFAVRGFTDALRSELLHDRCHIHV